MKEEPKPELTPRRRFLQRLGRGFMGTLIGGVVLGGIWKSRRTDTVWQIDPAKCTACGDCRTLCVKEISAVKSLHHFPICGYCDLCTGYFVPEPLARETGAENLICPTGAIRRRFVEDPFYEYSVDRDLCNGCAKCVEGCRQFGNGSLYLQIDHDYCLHCNECAIVKACPAAAVVRVPRGDAYLANDRGWG